MRFGAALIGISSLDSSAKPMALHARTPKIGKAKPAKNSRPEGNAICVTENPSAKAIPIQAGSARFAVVDFLYDRLDGSPHLHQMVQRNFEVTIMALLNANDDAPAFSVPNQDGALRTLEDYRGKHLLLWWYPKADTPG